uniref:Uncharacterized protein n=1 Tax=viral metagenome TaxID=1070528 RepID=A0A6C0CGX6_9ZZZZ
MNSICAEPGCHRDTSIWRKKKTSSILKRNLHLRFCEDHNKCRVCQQGTCWDTALCYDCDKDK